MGWMGRDMDPVLDGKTYKTSEYNIGIEKIEIEECVLGLVGVKKEMMQRKML